MHLDRKPSFRWHLCALVLLCPLLAAEPARAQDIATAEEFFNRGVEDMKAGRYETGCKALAESQRLDPRPGTLFTLATCEAEWGHIATAVTRFGDYLALYDRLPEDRKASQGERPNVAKARREKLAPEVPRLTLSLPRGAPAGTIVKRDGDALPDLAIGVALPVDPGEHVLSIQTPGGRPREQRITIGKGENKTVTLTLSDSTAAVAPTAPLVPVAPPTTRGTPPTPSRSYVGPTIAFGAGALGLGVGIGLGVTVLGKRAELDKACPNNDCPASEQGNLDTAKALSYGSTAGFVVAGVGAAAGVLLLVLPAPSTDKGKKVGVRLGAGYAGVEGVF